MGRKEIKKNEKASRRRALLSNVGPSQGSGGCQRPILSSMARRKAARGSGPDLIMWLMYNSAKRYSVPCFTSI